jgi:hypothetical protein
MFAEATQLIFCSQLFLPENTEFCVLKDIIDRPMVEYFSHESYFSAKQLTLFRCL